MTNLTTKFTVLEGQLAMQNEAILDLMTVLKTALDLINTQLDTMTVNNAANTKYLLAAIGANNPCAPCPTPPILVPPIADFDNPINEEKCKRAQAFLATMRDMFGVWDTFSSFDLSSNFTVITDAIGQVIARMGAGDVVPLPSFPEAVQLGGTLLSFTGYNLFEHTSLVEQFDPMYDDLLAAIYAEPTPSGAKGQYDSIVAAGVPSHFISDLMIGSAYNDLWSYFFDPASEPDLSPYDGTICGGEDECVIVTSPVDAGTSQYIYGGSPYQRVDVTAIDIAPRIIGSTTIECPVALTISFGGLVGSVPANTVISFTEMVAIIGTSPRYLDTANPSEENQIQFCGLAPIL
jgi:hypothetical protein